MTHTECECCNNEDKSGVSNLSTKLLTVSEQGKIDITEIKTAFEKPKSKKCSVGEQMVTEYFDSRR